MTDQQVPEAVRWLLDQQLLVRAPKREPLPTPIASGGSMATVLVAASDASDLSKSKADFQCLGADDQVTIRRAILAAGQVGTVWLSEGFYDCNIDTTNLNALSNFGIIRGLGRQSTYVNVTGTGAANETFLRMNGGMTLADLTIDVSGLAATGSVVWMTGGGHDMIDNCYLEAGSGLGMAVKMASNYASIRNTRMSASGYAVQLLSGFDFAMDSCHVDGGMEILGTGPSLISNTFFADGGIVGGNELTLVGCEVVPAGAWAIDILGSHFGSRGRFVGNMLLGGIRITGGDLFMIEGNHIDANQHGIVLHDTDDCTITDNLIEAPGTLVHNTYDGIHLSGTSSRNNIQDNRIIGRAAATPKPRYAINISAAACTSNVWNSNMAGPAGSFGTGVYNNAGTATQGANWTI